MKYFVTIEGETHEVEVIGDRVTLDGRRRNEHLFLANLGVSLPALIVLALLPPVIFEIAISISAKL